MFWCFAPGEAEDGYGRGLAGRCGRAGHAAAIPRDRSHTGGPCCDAGCAFARRCPPTAPRFDRSARCAVAAWLTVFRCPCRTVAPGLAPSPSCGRRATRVI